MGTLLWVASILITAATLLSKKKPKVANLDDTLSSNATQGAYLPLVIGRQLVGHVVLWVEDEADQPSSPLGFGDSMVLEGESNDTGLGKGGGSTPPQPFYRERALHGLAVGPGLELRAIHQNGEVLWEGLLTPDTAPSGTRFQTLAEPNSYFRVYWGFDDDPEIPYLETSETHGVPTNYSHAMKIMWDIKDLGQSRQWGRLEYEIVCPCYSQITTSPSQVPRTGDDRRPLVSDLIARGIPLPVGAYPQVPEDPGIFVVMWPLGDPAGPVGGIFYLTGGPYSNRALMVSTLQGRTNMSTSADYDTPVGASLFFSPGGVVKIWMNFTGPGNPVAPHPIVSSLMGGRYGQWVFFRITEAVHNFNITRFVNTMGPRMLSWVQVELGIEIEPDDPILTNIDLSAPNVNQWVIIEPVDTLNTDGVNPIHMIDQLLFAKFPHGAGKDRSKFDAQAIDVAAEQLQDEVIRGGIQIADGENVESVMAQLMQDITLMIPYNPETGKYSFRLVRYSTEARDIDDSVLLELPAIETIRGDRPVDTIAFTFKDRQRNFREVPIKVSDNGQIYENDTQRAQKVPIEVTQDRDSVSRMAPRRAQEALGALTTIQIKTNHGSFMAMPGSRVTLSSLDVLSIRYIISDVLRDPDSSKVELGLLLDSYDPPTGASGVAAQLEFDEPPQRSPASIAAEPLQDFIGIEVPRLLSSDQRKVEVFLAGVSASTRTLGARIYSSRDDAVYARLTDEAPLIGMGFLDEDLPADALSYDDSGSYAIVADQTSGLMGLDDLLLYPDQWRAGRQVMLIGNEVVFVRGIDVVMASDQTLGIQGAGYLEGLIRGRAGTAKAFHAAGTPFYVFLSHRVKPLSSDAFLPGKDLYYKAVPIERTKVGAIDSVDAKHLALTGKALTPLEPSALRLGAFLPDYDTGSSDDLEFRWSYHSREFPRTGLGHQACGDITGESQAGGHFIVKIYDGVSEGPVFQATTVETSFNVTQAMRTLYSLDTSSWSFAVVHVEGSFSSGEASTSVTPI